MAVNQISLGIWCEQNCVFTASKVLYVEHCLWLTSCCNINAALALQTNPLLHWQHEIQPHHISPTQCLGWVTNYLVNILNANEASWCLVFAHQPDWISGVQLTNRAQDLSRYSTVLIHQAQESLAVHWFIAFCSLLEAFAVLCDMYLHTQHTSW